MCAERVHPRRHLPCAQRRRLADHVQRENHQPSFLFKRLSTCPASLNHTINPCPTSLYQMSNIPPAEIWWQIILKQKTTADYLHLPNHLPPMRSQWCSAAACRALKRKLNGCAWCHIPAQTHSRKSPDHLKMPPHCQSLSEVPAVARKIG